MPSLLSSHCSHHKVEGQPSPVISSVKSLLSPTSLVWCTSSVWFSYSYPHQSSTIVQVYMRLAPPFTSGQSRLTWCLCQLLASDWYRSQTHVNMLPFPIDTHLTLAPPRPPRQGDGTYWPHLKPDATETFTDPTHQTQPPQTLPASQKIRPPLI
ncbi:hypothetical protein Pmani_028819 [Petrolisthes manimaculis]|uniref:Uncharacterized protein n=1 Tax=Petrolisthes manimaculis TaxID=1843537 RepID=A0AAE1NZZ2_9EUCA|nr:hypothetical protein Pmani_028819 [Petrolisthes manimaculis]